MQDFIFETFKNIEIGQLIATVGAIWFFYRRLEGKIEKLGKDVDEKFKNVDKKFDNVDKKFDNVDKKFENVDKKFENIDAKFEKLEGKIEKLAGKVEDVDRRLCRIEGSLATQGHCLMNQAKPEKKAQ